MNDHVSVKKVLQEAGKVKKDLSSLVEGRVSQFNAGFEKLADNALDAAATVKKDVGHGLHEYNANAQKAADHVPGDFSKMVARYPWVMLSLTLMIGFLLGSLLKTPGQPLDQF